MTRATFALLFTLTAHVGADPMPRQRHHDEVAPAFVRVIVALLDASRRYHLDPMLAFSVAWAESSLRPWCVTRRHGVITGRGLMQINPRYQDELVRKYLGWDPRNFDWANPVHSAKLGCAYLAVLIAKSGTWGGVASYNCGPGRFAQLAHGRALPDETVEYCRRIFG